MTLPPTRVPDPSTAPPLRWGIVAPGRIAGAFAHALKTHTRQELVAVGSRSQERADQFAAEYEVPRSYGSYDELLAQDDIDIVYIASPHSHHEEQARAAIAAGKHVLVEKAMSTSAESARRMVAAAREADVAVMEAMWMRFQPHIDVVKQCVEDGLLGPIEMLRADHGQAFPFDPHHRLYDHALGGGAMLDLGVYPLSFSAFLLGLPQRLEVAGTRTSTGVDRQVTVLLHQFDAHPHAHALATTTLAAKTPCTASVNGAEARIEIPGRFYQGQQLTIVHRDDTIEVGPEPTLTGSSGLAYEAAHFAQLVADDARESLVMPPDESIALLQLIEEALESMPSPPADAQTLNEWAI